MDVVIGEKEFAHELGISPDSVYRAYRKREISATRSADHSIRSREGPLPPCTGAPIITSGDLMSVTTTWPLDKILIPRFSTPCKRR